MRANFKGKWLTIGMVTLIAAFVGLGWYPLRRDIQRLRAQIAQTQQSILGAEGKADDLTELDRTVKQIRQEIASTSKVIPEQGELANLIRELSTTMEASHLTDPSIATDATVLGANYATMPIRVSFKGKSADAFDFIRKIDHMSRLVQVTNLDFHGQNGEGLINAEMKLNTYFYTTQEGSR
ncbi:MAG: type 4a pilus biogenesis protein PilO [Planctomycetes bacterium]|nr:type 4a pilus biogenesis protein PilO [Planctomycetota bacterium]